MGDAVVLEQTGAAAWTRFEFGERVLRYTLRADGPERAFETDYGYLPRVRGVAVSSREFVRLLGHLGVAGGVAWIALAFASGTSMLGGFVALGIGGLWLLIYTALLTPFTVLQVNEGAIWVMRGKQHDRILRELERRRRLRLRELHDAVRPKALLGAPARKAG
jgi:fatty acid desaturase